MCWFRGSGLRERSGAVASRATPGALGHDFGYAAAPVALGLENTRSQLVLTSATAPMTHAVEPGERGGILPGLAAAASLATMGLDLVDVTFRIEIAFKIGMSMDELSGLVKNNDIAVGDLYEFILKKLQLQDLGRNSVRMNAYLFREMQSALHLATGAPLERIELGLPLEALFPRENRRALWEALRGTFPYKIRDLDYSKFVRRGGLVLAATVVVIEQFQLWQIPGAKWFWPLLGIAGIWMVSETYLKILSVCAPLRTYFPGGITTVKDLCRNVMSANYVDICHGSEVAFDERSAAIWEQLVDVLVSALGVDAAEVTFRSRLIRDLGAA
ncbi:MAG TPA: hypothetical protein PK867_03405 [Pirellulales bacterium]|nr:hypothetical protein [Pirellulales bacterium]